MANKKQLDILRQGVEAWNQWRKERPDITYPDLMRADLRGASLMRANLRNVNLSEANLRGASLNGANISWATLVSTALSGAYLMDADFSNSHLALSDFSGAHLNGATLRGATLSRTDLRGATLKGADLSGSHLTAADFSDINPHNDDDDLSFDYFDHFVFADLSGANLSGADLTGANLTGANLTGANLAFANLSGANLSGANLVSVVLVNTNLTNATLTGCSIYGTSVWNVQLEGTTQDNLVITPDNEPTITVDNLEVAQFIYLLLNNPKVRDVIDTITSKVVLILGRFTPERKVILDALKDELRINNYLPILFDFEKPVSRDFTETISTLAHLARFIIADLTEPSSIPQELREIVPGLEVPVRPILEKGKKEYAMFPDLSKYPWFSLSIVIKTKQALLVLSKKRF